MLRNRREALPLPLAPLRELDRPAQAHLQSPQFHRRVPCDLSQTTWKSMRWMTFRLRSSRIQPCLRKCVARPSNKARSIPPSRARLVHILKQLCFGFVMITLCNRSSVGRSRQHFRRTFNFSRPGVTFCAVFATCSSSSCSFDSGCDRTAPSAAARGVERDG
eukprot:m.626207 g.626207  ORF g.626207 m.626207 type:complete len:162 (+) comp58239_c2_seq41:508-993(+)